MGQNNQFRHSMRLLMYKLKRQFESGPLDLYYDITSTTDLDTGDVEISRSKTRIKRAILLPEKSVMAIVQTISKISADKQFVFGGQFDRHSRVFLVDGKDLNGIVPNINDWLVYNDAQKYQLANFHDYYDGMAYLLLGQEQPGDAFSIIHDTEVFDNYLLQETAVDS